VNLALTGYNNFVHKCTRMYPKTDVYKANILTEPKLCHCLWQYGEKKTLLSLFVSKAYLWSMFVAGGREPVWGQHDGRLPTHAQPG
jgi:hypothetical protein